MKNYIMQTHNLNKFYDKTQVLDNVNISIEKGNIYGFIGQNGAGKTTLFRIIAGLAFLTKGELVLFNENSAKGLQNARKRIGCIIESPSLYPDMTAYQNLEIHQIGIGMLDKQIINKVLMLVGLSDTDNKRVKNFSLGMKQRLSIAIALLNDPEFLILDEPINGLDPVSIVEIRELLRKLCIENGITILISSHILSELHQLATNYIIIHKGKIIEELTSFQLDEKCKRHITIKVDNPSLAVTIFENDLKTKNFLIKPDETILLYDYLDNIESVSKVLMQKGLIISKIAIEGDSLENYFINLIGGVYNV